MTAAIPSAPPEYSPELIQQILTTIEFRLRDLEGTANVLGEDIDGLPGAASTTEVLTGTDAEKSVTPDSLAALWEKGADVASAGTLSLGEGGYFHVTGTTTITDIDFATPKDGRWAILVFDGVLTLTHHATTLILPGAANIATAAGDACLVVQDNSDNVKVVWYHRAAQAPNILAFASTTEILTGTDTAKAATADAIAALWEKGSDVASAGTISLGEGGFFHITGTTAITDVDFATAKNGRWAWVVFDGALTLTHHATTLILPGGANITTAAGDRALFIQDNSDNVYCMAYIKAAGTPVAVVPVSLGGTGQTTEAEALGEMTQALTEDTSPDRISDMVATYDNSADTGKKVALYNLAGHAVVAHGSVSGGSSLDLALDTWSQFSVFKLYIRNLTVATDNVALNVQFSDDGGDTFEGDAADYAWHYAAASGTSTLTASGDVSDSVIELRNALGNAAGESSDFELTIFSPASSDRTRITWDGVFSVTDGSLRVTFGGAEALVAGASTDIRLIASSGNISCDYTLVGIL